MDLFLTTNVAHADVGEFVGKVNDLIINPLITFLFAVAIAYFLYGVLKFIINQDNEEKKTEGRQHMLWGVIGITIMMGVFTILNIILRTFNITNIDVREGTVQPLR